jgi:hypothetical protein
VGKSRDIIELFVADLETYINDPDVMYEKYRELPEDLENRKITVNARIAMYMDSETEIVKYQAEKPADSRQQVNIDLSVIRGYRNENADNSELRALDLKDQIIDWVKQLDAYAISNGAIHSLGYDSSSGFTRKKQYITLTMTFSGQRDLLIAQTT